MTDLTKAAWHVDSSRFISSQLPDEISRGPAFKTSHLHSEFNYLPTASHIAKNPDVFSVDDIVEELHLHILRIIFIVLDVLLFVYRCSRIYLVTQSLCRGFKNTIIVEETTSKPESGGKNGADNLSMENHIQCSSMVDKEYMDINYTFPDTVATAIGNNGTALPRSPSPHHQKPSPHKQMRYLTPKAARKKSQGMCYEVRLLCVLLVKAIQSPLIPKVALASAFLILMCYCTEAICAMLTADILADLDIFRMYLVGLDVQVNRTNWYLSEQAKHFNHITMEIYKGQMTSELSHLQSMLEYFNIGEYKI